MIFTFFNEQTDWLTPNGVRFNFLIYKHIVSIVKCEQIRLLNNKTNCFLIVQFLDKYCHTDSRLLTQSL